MVLYGQWTYSGQVKIPKNPFMFMSANPHGNIVAVTFNDNAAVTPIPALLIQNPLSANPKVTELCRIPFEHWRGYSGVACDEKGNFYVSGDTGYDQNSFIRKFYSDGRPVPFFGNFGEIKPGLRCQGLDVFGNYLIVAVAWGKLYIYDRETGRKSGEILTGEGNYVRDIAIDPSTLNIFGVSCGGAVLWSGGAPWDPSKYTFRRITDPGKQPDSGEGISYDAILRKSVITPNAYNHLYLVDVSGQIEVVRNVFPSPEVRFTDSVVSFQGNTMFVSDMGTKTIHILKRTMDDRKNEIFSGFGGRIQMGDVPYNESDEVVWKSSYQDTYEEARKAGKPMFLFFMRKGLQTCQDLKESFLDTPEFQKAVRGYTLVQEDIAESSHALTAYRFGIYRVPSIVILDQNGEVSSRFIVNIDKNRVLEALGVSASGQ